MLLLPLFFLTASGLNAVILLLLEFEFKESPSWMLLDLWLLSAICAFYGCVPSKGKCSILPLPAALYGYYPSEVFSSVSRYSSPKEETYSS